MAGFKTVWSEFIGLFVDDGSLAAAILAWIGVASLVLHRLHPPPGWPPPILFLGLALILFESALRGSRRAP